MEEIHRKAIEIRRNKNELIARLDTFSNIIHYSLDSIDNDNERIIRSIINRLVRESSEVGSYLNTTDLIAVKTPRKKERRHEHVVPCNCITNYLIDNKHKLSKKDICDVLLNNGLRAIISISDDKKLNQKSMPSNWEFGMNPLMRYKPIIANLKLRD